MRYLIVLLLLAGCATQQSVTLLPRGDGGRGTGTFDHVHQMLTLELNGVTYQGTPVAVVSTNSPSPIFGPASVSSTNIESALLIGQSGQLRCEFTWGPMKTMAQGSCIDSRNATYDLLIRN